MEETEVRSAADAHARATVEGDFKTAGSYLSGDAMAQAGAVMKAMPGKLTGSEVEAVHAEGDTFTAHIRYTGERGDVVVESTWAAPEGEPKITGLKVL